MVMFYCKTVVGLITRSIIEFTIDAGHNTTTPQPLLPDIWVEGKKLYQHQTLDNGERRRYLLTYDKLLDPYEFEENFTSYTVHFTKHLGR